MSRNPNHPEASPWKDAEAASSQVATPTPRPVFTDANAYADWINRRIGAEVTRLRVAHGMTPYALGLACGVTDQTILNIERGKCDRGHLTGTLARICFHFGITLEALIDAAAA